MRKFGVLLIVLGLIGMIFTAKSFFARQTLSDAQSYPSERIEQIIIDSNYADVKVLPTDENNIIVTLEGDVKEGGKRSVAEIVSVNENAGKLYIDATRSWFLNISFFNFKLHDREDLTIYLPEKYYERMTITNDVGKTTVNDVTIDQLVVENSVANTIIENVKAKMITAENNVGNITLTNNIGKIYAENDVGNISVGMVEINDDLTFKANVGKIELLIPDIPNDITFKANTSLGSVKIFGENGSFINKFAEHIVSMTTDIGNITVDVQ